MLNFGLRTAKDYFMMMKKTIFLLLVLAGLSEGSRAQVTEVEPALTVVKLADTTGWVTSGQLALNFAQSSFTNWNSGGVNAWSVNGLSNFNATYHGPVWLWENNLVMGYGILSQGQGEQRAVMKTDDKFDLSSKYGRRVNDRLNLTALVNFRTQFADGFDYAVDSTNAISRLLAPGYLLGAVGVDFKPSANFSAFLAPLTSKTTFVLDERLAAMGAFGVDSAQSVRVEFGGYAKFAFQKELVENVHLLTRLDLFSNYLNNPQNIDISWEILLNLKVNSFLAASLGTHMLYDDDVRIAADTDDDGVVDSRGPRLQFKQVLGLGLTLAF